MPRYVIGVRRDHRREVRPTWRNELLGVDGLQVVGSEGEVRVVVEATEAAIAAARDRLGDAFHIEPEVVHERLDRD